MDRMALQAKLKRNISKVGNKCNNTAHLIYFHPLILGFPFTMAF